MLRADRVSKESRTRCTVTQINRLINYMSEHTELAQKGYSLTQSDHVVWEQIVDHLCEGTMRLSVDKLKVTWRDLKKNAKKELMAARLESRQGDKIKISRRTHKILSIIGVLKPNKNKKSKDGEITPRDLTEEDESMNDTSDMYETIDEDIIFEEPERRKNLVDTFEELAESKMEAMELKKEVLLKRLQQQEEIHALNMQIANEKLEFERKRNEMELEILKKKLDL